MQERAPTICVRDNKVYIVHRYDALNGNHDMTELVPITTEATIRTDERARMAMAYKAEKLPLPCVCGAGIGLYGTRSCTTGGCIGTTPKTFLQVLRDTVNEARRIHEESWGSEGDSLETPGRYLVSDEDAALKACVKNGLDPKVAPLLWLATSQYANDVQAWADGEWDENILPDGTYTWLVVLNYHSKINDPDAYDHCWGLDGGDDWVVDDRDMTKDEARIVRDAILEVYPTRETFLAADGAEVDLLIDDTLSKCRELPGTPESEYHRP